MKNAKTLDAALRSLINSANAALLAARMGAPLGEAYTRQLAEDITQAKQTRDAEKKV